MKNESHSSVSKVLLYGVTIVAIVSVGLLIYLYGQYSSAQAQLAQTKVDAVSEAQSLAKTISVFMELPQSENPTLATVTDVAKLPALPFFAHAKVGDKVLIYNNAAKAILYRPGTNKIIEVSVFTSPNVSVSPEVKKPLSVELRNGTTTTGITNDFEKKFKTLVPDASIVNKGNAARRDYSDSMVIASSTTGEEIVNALAKTVNFPVAQMPNSEASSTADILIILGKDIVSSL